MRHRMIECKPTYLFTSYWTFLWYSVFLLFFLSLSLLFFLSFSSPIPPLSLDVRSVSLLLPSLLLGLTFTIGASCCSIVSSLCISVFCLLASTEDIIPLGWAVSVPHFLHVSLLLSSCCFQFINIFFLLWHDMIQQ